VGAVALEYANVIKDKGYGNVPDFRRLRRYDN
jgi:hypothetical protein